MFRKINVLYLRKVCKLNVKYDFYKENYIFKQLLFQSYDSVTFLGRASLKKFRGIKKNL